MMMGRMGFRLFRIILKGIFATAYIAARKRMDSVRPKRVGRREEQDDINDGQNQLEPGVKPVHKAAARKVLADGDVSQHSDTPPFTPSVHGAG